MDKHDLTEDQKLVMWTLYLDKYPFMRYEELIQKFHEELEDMGRYYVKTVGGRISGYSKGNT